MLSSVNLLHVLCLFVCFSNCAYFILKFIYLLLFFVNFGDGNWRQAKAWIVLLARAGEVNALAQGVLQQFTQWPWIEHPTFQLRGGSSTTELLPPPILFPSVVFQHLSKSNKRGWFTIIYIWLPWSFTNPMWHSDTLCLHWSVFCPIVFSFILMLLTIGFFFAWCLFVLFLFISWVIWKMKSINQLLIIISWPFSMPFN